MDDLKLIKKYYGEEMMHLCRRLFPTILDESGKLFNILDNNFQRTKYLYKFIEANKLELKFKDYIYGLLYSEQEFAESKKNIYELMDEAGYNLYECNSESDILRFKKYYKKGEELCTFDDNRLETNYVYFAVKKNVDEIKREDFKHPKREDEYGTSVISIQFTKGDIQTLSIKNRYNHKVTNPDCTFNNNLENIIPGLTLAFVKDKGYNINQGYKEEIFENLFRLTNDKKHYFVLYEYNNISYGPDNIIIDNSNVITKYLEKEKYIVIENYILDLVNKKIFLYDERIQDDFINHIKNIKKITIKKNKENKKVILTPIEGEDIIIELDSFNRIIGYVNNNIEKIGDNCFKYCHNIKYFHLNNVKEIGNDFAPLVVFANDLKMPKLTKIASSFLLLATGPKILNLPSVIAVGNNFMKHAKTEIACLPRLEYIDSNFMLYNKKLKKIYIPSTRIIKDCFLYENEELNTGDFSSLESVGALFLNFNTKIDYLNFPSLKCVGDDFMQWNQAYYANFKSLENVGKNFLANLSNMLVLSLPNLVFADCSFLLRAKIKYIYAPKLKYLQDDALRYAKDLEYVDFKELQYVGDNFMENCSKIEESNDNGKCKIKV